MIRKRSGEFRGRNWCEKSRNYDELGFQSEKNVYYDNAIIAKDIIVGYLKGEYDITEFPDLVDQGVEDNYLTQLEGEARRKRLVSLLTRACMAEKRQAHFPGAAHIVADPYVVTVKPDAVFYNMDGSIDVVLYRVGKPDITMKGQKRDASVGQCLELYFLLQYAKTLVPEGKTVMIRANYYFLRKLTDTSTTLDPDFFSDKGGNIVFLEDLYTGGDTRETGLDTQYKKLLEKYEEGEECNEDDCRSCPWNNACNFTAPPQLYEKKTGEGKKGNIVPSDAQQAIIDFRKGVCRVNAAAGSGKTECMTERGARMMEEGVKPSEILFITFTDAGANEMKERIVKKCEARNLPISPSNIHAMTFNTFAYRVVKENYKDCGFTKPPMVLDDVRNSVIITQLLDENPVYGLDYMNYLMSMPNCQGALSCAKKVFDIIKAENLDPNDAGTPDAIKAELQENGISRFIQDSSVLDLIELYKDYDKRLKEDNLLQFADQEPLMNKVLELYPDYLEKFGYAHIIVDEFQDTNDVQLETIMRLTKCKCFKSLMVVGDDSQSIYAFRHTSPENILHFFDKIRMKGTDLYLVENRRSTPEIIDLANKINKLNENRVEKDMIPVREHGRKPIVAGFHSKAEEYAYVAKEMKMLIDKGTQPEDIAFVAYKKTELIAMAAELTKMGIPWVMKNPLTLVENSNVNAALSLAKAFWQPETDMLYFNYLAAVYEGKIFQELDMDEIKNKVQKLKEQFLTIDLLEMEQQRQIFHSYLEKIGENDEIYKYFIELIYQNEDLQSELGYINDFNRFGEKVAKKMEQTYQGVVLTTAHSSKGLEWKVLFNSITGFDKKQLHSGRNAVEKVEETRRLLFVSVTRARDLLYITGQYVAYGKKDDYTYNQFLMEVYQLLELEFNPIDVMADVRASKRKENAQRRRKKGKISDEDYEKMRRSSRQMDIMDILK